MVEQNNTQRGNLSAEETLLRSGLLNFEETFEEMHLDVTRLFYMLNLNLDTNIGLANTKAQLILGANVLLVGAISLDSGFIRNAVSASSTGETSILKALIIVALLISMLTSIFFALWTARARMVSPTDQYNLFFFGHIGMMHEKEYISRFMDMNLMDIKETILSQIHAKARILRLKFRYTNYSMGFLFLALVLWGTHNIVDGFLG